MDPKILNKFKKCKILVFGDVMLDEYAFGNVERISPEAPVPIVNINNYDYRLGGAGNTANNVSKLGGDVTLVGVVGNDYDKTKLFTLLEENGINNRLFVDKYRKTTCKTRIMSQKQQLLRIDKEDKQPINIETEKKIIKFIYENKKRYDIIILSDYAKGFLSDALIHYIINNTKIRVIVDPKPPRCSEYEGCYLITPNLKEADGMGESLLDVMSKTVSNVLVTKGKDGMSLYKTNGQTYHIPTVAKQVFDVSGAGDTVIATIALCLASGMNLEDSAIIANHAAGIVVSKIGTATLTLEELKRDLNDKNIKSK